MVAQGEVPSGLTTYPSDENQMKEALNSSNSVATHASHIFINMVLTIV